MRSCMCIRETGGRRPVTETRGRSSEGKDEKMGEAGREVGRSDRCSEGK